MKKNQMAAKKIEQTELKIKALKKFLYLLSDTFLMSDVLLWTPTHGKQKLGRPERSYIDQLADDTGCNPQELDNAMSNKEDWRKRVMQCRSRSTR